MHCVNHRNVKKQQYQAKTKQNKQKPAIKPLGNFHFFYITQSAWHLEWQKGKNFVMENKIHTSTKWN